VSCVFYVFFFSSRRRHTRFSRDWSSDVCSSDLVQGSGIVAGNEIGGNGLYGTGPNVIEFNSFGTLTVDADAQIYERGTSPTAERSEERRVGNEWRRRGATEH